MTRVRMIIELDPATEELLEGHATILHTDSDYFFLPFWFKKIDEGYELIRLKKIPSEIAEAIINLNEEL